MKWIDFRMQTAVLIGIGAFVGANLRYLMSTWIGSQFGQNFPYGTLLINVSGSFLLAVFIAWAARHTALAPQLRLLIAVGFCGGYTTYSSFTNETIALIQREEWMMAGFYIIATNLLCLLAVLPGLWLGSKL